MPPKRSRDTAALQYPKHAPLKPTDLLHFVCEDGFLDDCHDIGLSEDDINAIELAIMAGGKDSPVIEGTGGLRKMRFAPEKWKVGKSGAARVCFVFFQQFWTVLLVTVYRKSQYDTLSNAAKALFAKLIAEAEAELERMQQIKLKVRKQP